MPHIIYPDTEPKRDFFVNPRKLNPVRKWLQHYENFKYLKLIFDSPKTAGWERRQANKEIQTCERKLAYWMKMVDMDAETRRELETSKAEVDRQWAGK